MDISASVLSPDIGAKFSYQLNSLVPHIFVSYYFARPEYVLNSSSDDIADYAIDNILNEVIRFSGLKMGLGAEYFFSDNFSIGGQFGFNFAFSDYKIKQKIDVLGTSYDLDLRSDNTIIETETGITLNFYFFTGR
ncbi:MAG: hypothetical protein JW827_09380 [Spirochaetes bacterium]|nr:hypothetical protein [Spirochaetota bacterium]